MLKFIVFLPLVLACTLLSSCSTLQFPGVYKVTVEQGNVITQDMVDQLKPGMSTDQVEYIMGSPLIKDTLNPGRWDYLYSISRGGKPRKQQRISLFFKNEQLEYFTGDFVPTSISQQLDSKATES